jgi:poly(3-hydroxybutyrate) depolymerase
MSIPYLRVAALAAIAVFSAILLPAQTAHPALSHFSLSSGCGKAPASTGQSKVETKDGRGFTRTYLLLVPKDYDPHKTYSLVFVLHGSGGTSETTMGWGLQNAKGAAESAVFLFPQGVAYHLSPAGWDDTPSGYDMPLFDTLASSLEDAYCIDRDEVFVAGFSWGGDFAISLSCARGDTIRAVAVNSAGDEFKNRADASTYRYSPCASRIHPAVRFQHAVNGDSAYTVQEFTTTSQFFAKQNQCSGESKPIPSSTTQVSCRLFAGCAHEYTECPFDANIGHALPPNWAQDTWDFFASFREKDRDISHYR